jgi:hypothetical protein
MAPVGASTIVDDEFDDDDPGVPLNARWETNTYGVGGPYSKSEWAGSRSEDGGILTLGPKFDSGNIFILCADEDPFDAWNSDGITASISAGNASPPSGEGAWIRSSFAIVDNDSATDGGVYRNQGGGLFMEVFFTRAADGSIDVDGRVTGAAADKPDDEWDSKWNDVLASFEVDGLDGGTELNLFQIYVNEDGWQAAVAGDVTWTDELVGGTSSGNTYGQSWSIVNDNASFTTDDPGDDSDYLDETVFDDDAVANMGFDNASSGSGSIDFDWWTVETGNTLIPEPATMSLLAFGGLGVLIRRRNR